MKTIDKVKANKRQEVSEKYEQVLQDGNSFVLNGKTIALYGGKATLNGLSLALQSAKIQQKPTVRFSDANAIHEVSIADLENLIGQATIWGDQQWNKKADIYQQLEAIKVENYPSESAAIAAVNALQWQA